MRVFSEHVAIDTVDVVKGNDTQDPYFGSLAQVLDVIAKHADPKFKPSGLGVSDNVARRLIDRTPGLIVSVMHESQAEQTEEVLASFQAPEILTINNSLKIACERSKHPSAEVVRRYVCGYMLSHIAMLHGFSDTDQVYETIFYDPTTLPSIINAPSNIRNIGSKTITKDNAFEFVLDDTSDRFIEPPAVISRSLA